MSIFLSINISRIHQSIIAPRNRHDRMSRRALWRRRKWRSKWRVRGSRGDKREIMYQVHCRGRYLAKIKICTDMFENIGNATIMHSRLAACGKSPVNRASNIKIRLEYASKPAGAGEQQLAWSDRAWQPPSIIIILYRITLSKSISMETCR